MPDLHPTSTRLATLRAIDSGDVLTYVGTDRAWMRRPGHPFDRDVTARVGELRDAGLAVVREEDADMDVQAFGLTEAGRVWLAEHDTTTKD